jgi:hypothetical protein
MPRGIPNEPKQAKDSPVILAKTIETSEQPLGHSVRVPTATSQAGEPMLVQVAERMPDPEKAAMLAFMNEMVTIRPTRTTDPKEQVFEITINNRSELFRVGEVKQVKRYYVDHLARMKVTSFSQQEVQNAEGEKQIKNIPYTTLKYDFAMVEDRNPVGANWLKATLAMAG